jgi:hypothetical protein
MAVGTLACRARGVKGEGGVSLVTQCLDLPLEQKYPMAQQFGPRQDRLTRPSSAGARVCNLKIDTALEGPRRNGLDALLEATRLADVETGTPERIEGVLLLAYREGHRGKPGSSPQAIGLRGVRDWLWTGLAAAAAAAALVVVTRPGGTPTAPAAAEVDQEQGFTPLVYGDPWSDVEAVQVIRVEMPRTALAALGYLRATPASDATTAVRADLLVGNDGIARGIRFVQ